MKFLTISFVFAMFVSAQAMTDAEREKTRPYSLKCIKETGVDEALISRLRADDLEFSDVKMNSYVHCMMKKFNLISDDGSLNVSGALDVTREDIKEAVGRVLNICAKEGGASNEEKAFNYIKCYYKHRPEHELVL